VARVPCEITRRPTMVQLLRQTGNLIDTDPEAHTVNGKPVTRAELNAVGQILLDPEKRIVEELLEHASESLSLVHVRKLLAEVVEAMSVASSGSLSFINSRQLNEWINFLLKEFLDEVPAVGPSFGALELEIIPPFGR
jgi:hypothetical protein